MDFCGTQKLFAVFTRADQPVFVLKKVNPVHTFQFYCFKIHSSIILACFPKSSGSRPEHYMHLWSLPGVLNTHSPSFLDS